MSEQWHVYTGFWQNQAKGPILGWTLTTTNGTGLVLVAAIGIFVSLLSGHIWGILCFVLHQWHCTRDPQDGLYHQQQVLLANAVEPTSSVWQLVKMGSAWKGRATHSQRRVVPLTLVAATAVVLFNLAGIFSSQINNQFDEVLIRSPSCGYLWTSSESNFADYTRKDWQLLTSAMTEQTTTSKWSKFYQRSCYNNDTDPSVDCTFFAVPKIDSTWKYADCPFDDKICLFDGDVAVEVISDRFSSGDLGMNVKPEDGIWFQKKMTCAPIQTDGYNDWGEGNENALPSELFNYYYYGDYISKNFTNNLSFVVDTYTGNGSTTPYGSSWVSYFPGSTDNTWLPIAELNRTDADVTLVWLMTNVIYTEPVKDPWFNATSEITSFLGYGEKLYQNPDMLIVMGCAEQYQICDSKSHDATCSPFTSYYGLENWADDFYKPSVRKDVVANLILASTVNNVGSMIGYLGSDSFAATDQLVQMGGLVSAPLDDDAWRTEIINWHDFLMARQQRVLISIATGPWNPASAQYVQPIASDYRQHWHVCEQMMVRDSRYYSFSGLGLAITLLLGLAIILTNLGLSTFVAWLQRSVFKSQRGKEMREDWMLDGLFQLQRMAFEGAKLGTWARRTDHDIPVTLKGPDFKDERFGKPHRTVSSYEELQMEPTPSLGYGNDQHSIHKSGDYSMGSEDLRRSWFASPTAYGDEVSLMSKDDDGGYFAQQRRDFI